MPDEIKDEEVKPLTPEEKISLVQSKQQADDPNASLVEAAVPEDVKTIPGYVIRQSWAYHFYGDPVRIGDKIEVVVLKNGTEVAHMTHPVVEAIPDGMELRPFINYGPTVMVAFQTLT